MKRVEELTVQDLQGCRVWEFVPEEETQGRDIFVRPILDLPIREAGNRIFGTKVTLHNGSRCWAALGNIVLNNRKSTQHFLMISVVRDGNWLPLARYHDFDYSTRGPQHLANFLGLSINDVFPISYDISALAIGLPEVISGRVPVEIDEKLSKSELIGLSLE